MRLFFSLRGITCTIILAHDLNRNHHSVLLKLLSLAKCVVLFVVNVEFVFDKYEKIFTYFH